MVIKGGSTTPTKNAIVDLTSFGFSRGKRPAPTPPPAASVAPASPTLSSSDHDDDEDDGPPTTAKRLRAMSRRDLPRTSSPPVHDESSHHNQHPEGDDDVKKSSSAGSGSTTSSSTTRAALLDLTRPESTASAAAAAAPPYPKLDTLADMGMACVETILGGGGGGGGQQRRGKRERFNNGTNDGVDGGGKRQRLPISIFEDPPSLLSSGTTKVATIQRVAATTDRRGKVHAKNNAKHDNSSNSQSPKKPQLLRDGSIQSHFSSSPSSANNGTSSSSPKSGTPTKSKIASESWTRTSPPGTSKVITYHNLALLRVADPHQIACTIAVKRAKDSATPYDELDDVPHIVHPNAYLGRSSSSRNNQSNFVDIGIPGTAMGISRRHLDIVDVTGLRSSSGGGDTLPFSHSSSSPSSRRAAAAGSSSSSSSSSTTASTGSSSTASGNSRNHPEMIVKVYEKASNGIQIYRTRRGERKYIYIPQGQQISLRIGDAVQFISNKNYPYCVVGLVTNQYKEEEIVEIVDTDEDNDDCGKGMTSRNNSVGMDVAPSFRRDDIKSTSSSSSSVAKVASKTMVNGELTPALADLSQDTISILNSNNTDIPTNEKRVCQKMPTVVGESKMSNNQSSVKKQVPLFQVGTVVSVQDRTWPGRNDVGGVARIINVQANDDGDITYDVKYILESRREKFVDEQYIMIHIPDVNMGGSPRKRVTTKSKKNKDDDDDTNMDDDNAPLIGKGDYVKILFETTDMFGDVQREWYCGDVVNVTRTQQKCKIRVQFLDTTFDTFDYPSSDVKKLDRTSIESSIIYPEVFAIGDIVDANFQDGGEKSKWFRGRVAFVDEEAGTCDVMYYDGEYESSIPINEKKILFAHRDSSGGWLVGKTARLSRDNEGRCFMSGQVSKLSTGDYQVIFDDKSKIVDGYSEVAKAVFDNLRMKLPLIKQHVWPVSNIRRQRRDHKTVMNESSLPIPKVKVEPTAIRSNKAISSKYVTIKAEPVDEMVDALDLMDSSWIDSNDVDILHLYIPPQGGCAVESSIRDSRKVAKEFPPGLPNMLWCGLNSPEAQTVSNFLWNLLCAHDLVPPTTMTIKLMDLMKYGPKAEGSSVHFKDPHRTELVSYYVFGLLSASKRLVRRDTGALFGPSMWDDIKVLMSQSLTETENMISGRRLAQGLHLAARGARLLSTMLLTELSGHDLYSTSNVVLDPTALRDMPTVRLIKSHGVRSTLKFAVEQMTKCLVRHSRWVMDSGGIELATNKSTSDESCCLESRVCLDNLASVVCIIAWLFCVEETCELKDPSVAFVIKDSFLVEVERSLEDLPQMNKQIRTMFIRKCKMYFFMSFVEGFSIPLKLTLAKMIGVDSFL